MLRKSHYFVAVTLVILAISAALVAPEVAFAPGLPPQTDWTVDEPLSPVGFLAVTQPEGIGHGYEFTMLNGTSASVTIPIKPTEQARLPLNLNLSVRADSINEDGQYLSTGLINVSAVVTPNPIILEKFGDTTNATITFIAKKDATNTLYEIQLGMWSSRFEPGAGLGALYYLRIKSASNTTETGTTTTTATATTTTSTSLTQQPQKPNYISLDNVDVCVGNCRFLSPNIQYLSSVVLINATSPLRSLDVTIDGAFVSHDNNSYEPYPVTLSVKEVIPPQVHLTPTSTVNVTFTATFWNGETYSASKMATVRLQSNSSTTTINNTTNSTTITTTMITSLATITSTERTADASAYAWAVSVIVAAAVLAIVLVLQRRRTGQQSIRR